VEIEVPPDTLLTSADVELLGPAPARQRPAGDPDLIERAAKLLGGAKNPLIFAGGGILGSEAWDELLVLAELLQAPVVLSSNGKGAISDRHYLAQSSVGGMELIQSADAILAVGTRFVDPATARWKLEPGRAVIQLDIDPEEVGRNYDVTVGIVADAKAGLAALAERVGAHSGRRPSREAELTEFKDGVTARINAIQPQTDLAMAIRHALPDEGIVVSEMTQIGYWSNLGYPVYRPRTFITPGYQGTLGYGFPTALGVKVGNPGTPVVSVNGDGGFGFALNELSTMVKHGINAVVVVFNDSAYGNVRRIQRDQYAGRLIASDLLNPDLLKLADAFGVVGRRADGAVALRTAIEESVNADEPTLIEVPVEVMPNPWTALGLR